jgi:hypothetical protein
MVWSNTSKPANRHDGGFQSTQRRCNSPSTQAPPCRHGRAWHSEKEEEEDVEGKQEVEVEVEEEEEEEKEEEEEEEEEEGKEKKK